MKDVYIFPAMFLSDRVSYYSLMFFNKFFLANYKLIWLTGINNGFIRSVFVAPPYIYLISSYSLVATFYRRVRSVIIYIRPLGNFAFTNIDAYMDLIYRGLTILQFTVVRQMFIRQISCHYTFLIGEHCSQILLKYLYPRHLLGNFKRSYLLTG